MPALSLDRIASTTRRKYPSMHQLSSLLARAREYRFWDSCLLLLLIEMCVLGSTNLPLFYPSNASFIAKPIEGGANAKGPW
jgi:hypothetical protein